MSDERPVIRPSLPGLFWGAAALWAGMAVAESAWWQVADGRTPWGLAVASLGAVIVGWLWRDRGSVPLICVGLVCGIALGGVFWLRWNRDVAGLTAKSPGRWRGEVVSDSKTSQFGSRSDVECEGVGRVAVNWPKDVAVPPAGREVEFFGSYQPPGDDDWGRQSHRSGTLGSVRTRVVHDRGPSRSLRGLVQPVRSRALAILSEVPGDGGALLDGVVLGERTRLAGTQAESDFKTTGLTHLVAVSGGHLVVIAVCLEWLLRRLRVRRNASALLVTSILGLYVVISGVQASAIRSWLMAAVLAATGFGQRRGDGLGALSTAVFVALALSPPAAFDLGMQLSVAAVGGLMLFGRLAERWALAAVPGTLASKVGSPIALTLVAQAATVPLTVGTFGMLSLVSPVANVLVGPLVSFALPVALVGVGTSAASEPLGRLVLGVAGAAGNVAASVASWLAGWPGAAIPLGFDAGVAAAATIVLAGALWVWWPRPRPGVARATAVGALALLLALAVGPPPPAGPRVVVMDVGQGDAVLIRDGRHAVLVDAGPDSSSLRAACVRQGVRHLDAVLVTHLHDDHFGGLGGLKGIVSVDRVLVAAGAAAKASEAIRTAAPTLAEVSAGDELRVGSIRARVLWPCEPVSDPSANESSIVLAVEADGASALLTGDAEAIVLDQLAGAGQLADVDALKVGHHGSADAVSAESLNALRPEVAIISVGAGNRFGHPVASTLDVLASSGSRVVRTDYAGDVTLRFGGKRLAISTQKNGDTQTRYEKLESIRVPHVASEAHGSPSKRPESGLPDHLRAEVARRSSPRAPEDPRWRGG